MRVIVCGGRAYADRDRLFAELDKLKAEAPHDALTIIQGGAKGADALAVAWCKSRLVPFDNYPAHWSAHGPKAGPLRNQRMLTHGQPDLVLAFPGGAGTADMVRRATSAGVEVRQVTEPQA